MLIVNLAGQLNALGNKTKIFTYIDGFLYKELKDRGIDFEFKDLKEIKIEGVGNHINSDDILVWFIYFEGMYYFKQANPKVLAWVIIPTAFTALNRLNKYNLKFLTKFAIKKIYGKNALIFMDKTCVDEIERFYNLKLNNPTLLPIPIINCEVNRFLKVEPSKEHSFQVTYIGRGVIWKYYPCLKILNDLAHLKDEKPSIIFHIITQDIEFYRNRIAEKNAELSKIEIKYHDNLIGGKLDDFLIRNSNLHISMGTACLEGGKLGIPSLLIDASYSEMPEAYKYRWIFETENYCLGNLVNKDSANFKGESLEDIIYKLQYEKIYAENISRKCYSYVNENHSLRVITKLFLKIVEGTELKLHDILGYSIRDNPIFIKLKGSNLFS